MRNSEARRYARWAAGVAMLLALVVAGVYLRGVWVAKQAEKKAPPAVPAAIEQRSNEFSYSKVEGQRTKSLVLTLSSQSSASSHQVATEVFRRQFDLASGTRKEQQVTIVDDRYDVFKDEDIERLERVSAVVPFSARKDVVALLAA